MKNSRQLSSSSARQPLRRSQRGAALITTLLLLLLLTAMSVAMVLATSSDMLINGYYRNFRGSFYGADSGLNIARQAMVNQFLAAVPKGNFPAIQQPIPNGTDAAVQTYLMNTYGQANQSINAGQAATSWPGSFKIINTAKTPTAVQLASCTVVGGGGTCAAPTGTPTEYDYLYTYSLAATGQATGTESATLTDSGQLTFKVLLTPGGGQVAVNFAAWGTFIDNYALCSAPFVPGTLTGPFFTNGAWNFGTSGKYTFTDTVGSANPDAGYFFSGGCDAVAGPSDTKSGTTIAPTFQNGFNLGQPSIPLPPNDYGQKRAVLDSLGTNTAPVTNVDLNASLRNVTKAAYPLGGTTSGVYLPYSVDPISGKAVMTGGGIYVEGDANVVLSPSGAAQVYTITQGGVTTTVTIDPSSYTTTVSTGGSNLTINGVPTQKDPSSGSVMRDATMLYVDGNINSLSGPAEYQPAISDGMSGEGTALTVTAAKNVTVTGDIRYATEPVTTTQNQVVPGTSPACCNGTPADTLIPGANKGQTLGIFTATGDIQMNNGQSDSNLWIDATIAMISQGGSGGWINVGPHINTLTLVGGRIANQAKSGNTTTRNIFFDRRYLQNGFSPPWYPSTVVTQNANGNAAATVNWTVTRNQWTDQSSY
ncbi:MAG TPA: PilX N-terminal domain-containing pilus assembly protein [Candidatus Acidoferrales bacterium]|nr:PilX N-terminal domain-containing pilus assembly protein [Candidatus Acidoferrales bacterium]